MSKVKIKLVVLGETPKDLKINKLIKWQSDIFEIVEQINRYTIKNNSDGPKWVFTDKNISDQLLFDFKSDLLIAMTSVPLEDNYYSRCVAQNMICITFYQMADILNIYNIPIENLVYRLLYSYSLIYKRNGDQISSEDEVAAFTHDDTRGCLFDNDGIKSDIVHSTDKPKICNSCVSKMEEERVPVDIINKATREIHNIKKNMYYKLADTVKKHPIVTLIISAFSALILGTLSSIIATALWEQLIK